MLIGNLLIERLDALRQRQFLQLRIGSMEESKRLRCRCGLRMPGQIHRHHGMHVFDLHQLGYLAVRFGLLAVGRPLDEQLAELVAVLVLFQQVEYLHPSHVARKLFPQRLDLVRNPLFFLLVLRLVATLLQFFDLSLDCRLLCLPSAQLMEDGAVNPPLLLVEILLQRRNGRGLPTVHETDVLLPVVKHETAARSRVLLQLVQDGWRQGPRNHLGGQPEPAQLGIPVTSGIVCILRNIALPVRHLRIAVRAPVVRVADNVPTAPRQLAGLDVLQPSVLRLQHDVPVAHHKIVFAESQHDRTLGILRYVPFLFNVEHVAVVGHQRLVCICRRVEQGHRHEPAAVLASRQFQHRGRVFRHRQRGLRVDLQCAVRLLGQLDVQSVVRHAVEVMDLHLHLQRVGLLGQRFLALAHGLQLPELFADRPLREQGVERHVVVLADLSPQFLVFVVRNRFLADAYAVNSLYLTRREPRDASDELLELRGLGLLLLRRGRVPERR